MTTLVGNYLGPLSSAQAANRRSRQRRCAHRLIKHLKPFKNILITAHTHPDPDALATSEAMRVLLERCLPGVKIQVRFKGSVGGGINANFARLADIKYLPWDDAALRDYDAIVLVDTQPTFSNSPLPAGVLPTAVVDHHRGRGRRSRCPHVDVRTEIGACASILYSYFMELDQQVDSSLATIMLYAIESDLAGSAGQQGGLDTLAISSLTLLADTKRLYQMRYVSLPETYYATFACAIDRALRHDDLIISHLDKIRFHEEPAVMADFLVRCQNTHWTFVTAVTDNRLVFSLRTQGTNKSAGEVARRLVHNLGDAGGHLTKAGGSIPLVDKTQAEIDRVRATLRRRLLRCLKIKSSRGLRLV